MDPRYKSPTANVQDIEESAFRDLGQITTALRWMLSGGAAVAVISLLSSVLQLELLSRAFTEEEGSANDEREMIVGLLELGLSVATVVVFARWILLAHRNLPALGARTIDFKPGWAVGWFFIPIANLWKPYVAMKSLWHHSQNAVRPPILETPGILPAWWTLWLIVSFLGNMVMRMSFRAEGIDELVVLTQITIASCIFDAVLCVVAAMLVTRIWKAQRLQHENPVELQPAGFADAPVQTG